MHKVCHVTSLHPAKDGRIFERECKSLTRKYEVFLVTPNTETRIEDGIHIVGFKTPATSSRLQRWLKLGLIIKPLIDIDADVYHFHDPELMSIGLKMQKRGKVVIFDSHEDVPAQIMNKTYIPTSILRKIISKIYEFYEKRSLRHYDSVVTVTPSIVERLSKINPQTYMLTNYPIYNDGIDKRTWNKKIGFAGLVTHNWNIHNVLSSIKDLDLVFELAGPSNDSYLTTLKKQNAWEKVNYHGVMKHSEVLEMLNDCTIGLALESYNNPNAGGKKGSIGVTKMFEYMMVGIPVIATDLENWVPIVEGNDCGFCVDPTNIEQIKEKILFLLNNPSEAKRLGDNGRKAVKEKYCWQTQEKTLFDMYDNLLKTNEKF